MQEPEGMNWSFIYSLDFYNVSVPKSTRHCREHLVDVRLSFHGNQWRNDRREKTQNENKKEWKSLME